jgi:hypothetical protein
MRVHHGTREVSDLKASRAIGQKNMTTSLLGLGTKNHFAGEGQQQCSVQLALRNRDLKEYAHQSSTARSGAQMHKFLLH